jgi:hypothetical protein
MNSKKLGINSKIEGKLNGALVRVHGTATTCADIKRQFTKSEYLCTNKMIHST